MELNVCAQKCWDLFPVQRCHACCNPTYTIYTAVITYNTTRKCIPQLVGHHDTECRMWTVRQSYSPNIGVIVGLLGKTETRPRITEWMTTISRPAPTFTWRKLSPFTGWYRWAQLGRSVIIRAQEPHTASHLDQVKVEIFLSWSSGGPYIHTTYPSRSPNLRAFSQDKKW